jgi:predicted nuclease with RNAse H fold
MSIVGLDLAGVESRPTGFCALTDMKAETCLVYTDKEIVEKTVCNHPKIVAIDAPLCLPPGRKSIDERTNIHLRESDKQLLKMGIKLFPVTLGPMRKLTTRGIRLKSTLEAQKLTVIEAYPGGAQDVLGIPRKQQGLEKLRAGLEKLGIKGLSSQMSNHELDAATCAYVGQLFLKGKAVIYGTPSEGIVMPKNQNSPKVAKK